MAEQQVSQLPHQHRLKESASSARNHVCAVHPKEPMLVCVSTGCEHSVCKQCALMKRSLCSVCQTVPSVSLCYSCTQLFCQFCHSGASHSYIKCRSCKPVSTQRWLTITTHNFGKATKVEQWNAQQIGFARRAFRGSDLICLQESNALKSTGLFRHVLGKHRDHYGELLHFSIPKIAIIYNKLIFEHIVDSCVTGFLNDAEFQQYGISERVVGTCFRVRSNANHIYPFCKWIYSINVHFPSTGIKKDTTRDMFMMIHNFLFNEPYLNEIRGQSRSPERQRLHDELQTRGEGEYFIVLCGDFNNSTQDLIAQTLNTSFQKQFFVLSNPLQRTSNNNKHSKAIDAIYTHPAVQPHLYSIRSRTFAMNKDIPFAHDHSIITVAFTREIGNSYTSADSSAADRHKEQDNEQEDDEEEEEHTALMRHFQQLEIEQV